MPPFAPGCGVMEWFLGLEAWLPAALWFFAFAESPALMGNVAGEQGCY
ncbi:MAG: hypothetical protein ISN29_03600 [Gammaproteobacteria bacterium AqS3]|nr:hypothetical protein [Gammaproteobacteria bacterium AqS3]